MGIQRKILLYMGKSFEISPSEKLTVCHFIRCIFTFSEKEISGKKEKTEEKMNFREKEQTGTRKKSEKFRRKRKTQKTTEKRKNGRNAEKNDFWEKSDNEKEDFSENRIFLLSESKFQERTPRFLKNR